MPNRSIGVVSTVSGVSIMSSSLDTEYLLAVAADPEIYTRVKLVMQLCDFLEDEESREAERDAIAPVLLKICDDDSAVVRRTLLGRIKASTRVPMDVAVAFVADEEDMACDILKLSPVLDDNVLVGIAKICDTPRQLAMCERTSLPPRLGRTLIEHGDELVVRAVLANPAGRLDEAAYGAIETRHGSLKRFESLLMKRRDVPSMLALDMVDAVSERLLKHASQKNWLDADKAARVISDAKEQGLVRIIARSDPAREQSFVSELMLRDRITPTLLLRAACIGKMDFVEVAIGRYTAMPSSLVHSMMYARGSVGFKALYFKAKLPGKMYPAMRVAVDVFRELHATMGEWTEAQFGRRMIERILTQYEEFSDADKKYLLSTLRKYAGEEAQPLLNQVIDDLAMAA